MTAVKRKKAASRVRDGFGTGVSIYVSMNSLDVNNLRSRGPKAASAWSTEWHWGNESSATRGKAAETCRLIIQSGS